MRNPTTSWSPLTGTSVPEPSEMHCAPSFLATLNDGRNEELVRCVGGNDAVVVIF